MKILAIDPGTYKSAVLLYDTERAKILECLILANNDVAAYLKWSENPADRLAIEWVSSYGMAVGKEVFETCYWVGVFAEKFGRFRTDRIPRKDIKLHLCNSSRAKDKNVRQALMDRFEPTGRDGKGVPSVRGTKAHPGPLYGVGTHLWSALAVAVTWADTHNTHS